MKSTIHWTDFFVQMLSSVCPDAEERTIPKTRLGKNTAKLWKTYPKTLNANFPTNTLENMALSQNIH